MTDDLQDKVQRIATAARSKERDHDYWHIKKADGEELDLVTNPPVSFEWICNRYPGAAISRLKRPHPPTHDQPDAA